MSRCSATTRIGTHCRSTALAESEFCATHGERAAPLDVERLGFDDLLAVADALLQHYPPDTIVCSHSVKADKGALTTAAIADLVESCRPDPEPA